MSLVSLNTNEGSRTTEFLLLSEVSIYLLYLGFPMAVTNPAFTMATEEEHFFWKFAPAMSLIKGGLKVIPTVKTFSESF